MFRIITEAKQFSEYVLLRDGQGVLLRTATAEDVPLVEDLMKRTSRESLQMRFMGAVALVPRTIIEIMCTGEPRDRLCLLAIVGHEAETRVVGVGNYISLGVRGKAEVAFLIEDAFQGRGISTLLLERLAGIAAGNGFVGFEAEVLYENQAMINVFRDSGFEVVQALDGGSIHVQFPVSGAGALRERVELRDRIAAANSLVPLLQPRTVAVIGASRDPGAIGSMIFRNILKSNFGGTVFPVNNQATSIHGVRAYPSIQDLPEPADLVVVAVPAPKVLEVAEESIRAGAKALLVITSGFAESGPEGAAQQQRLVDLVRSSGARLVGPNCLGLMNTHPEVSLNASLAPSMPPRGRIGFYSHSAAMGLVILNYAAERGLGFSIFVSAGNRADVSGNDLLQFWEEDSSTDIALLYLETFGNPRRFARVARRISFKKPILCVKGARSRAGRDAARAHIGAVGQSDVEVDVLFRQAGVIRADTLEEMFDVAVLLAHQPLPRGNRVAIISNSGGVLTICADACETHGLTITGPGLKDLGPLATVDAYERSVQEALEHDEVDALIALFACVGDCDSKPVGRAIRRGVIRAERNTGVLKPALLCLMGAAGAVQFALESPAGEVPSRHIFPSYRFPESAALALARAAQYSAYRRQPGGRLLWYEDVEAASARQEVQTMLAATGAGADLLWVEGERAFKILGFFGIRSHPMEASLDESTHEQLGLEVRSDPHFGPLIRLCRAGKNPVIRITPLTDHDVRELAESAEVPIECGIDELLGRVSQLIEELPWMSAMQASIHRVEHPDAPCTVALGTDVKLGFSHHELITQ
ncbi:MAG: GNAT family N-acetyltransferase [Acidobacteriia bacterium]|nr:GNAT family N-acetyltransferase [Terriglobia bacterium]